MYLWFCFNINVFSVFNFMQTAVKMTSKQMNNVAWRLIVYQLHQLTSLWVLLFLATALHAASFTPTQPIAANVISVSWHHPNTFIHPSCTLPSNCAKDTTVRRMFGSSVKESRGRERDWRWSSSVHERWLTQEQRTGSFESLELMGECCPLGQRIS